MILKNISFKFHYVSCATLVSTYNKKLPVFDNWQLYIYENRYNLKDKR